MTPNQAKWALACLPMVQAYAEGKEVQVNTALDGTGEWRKVVNPDWSCGPAAYRVKPEPREFYINIYANGYQYLHTSELEARKGCTLNGKPSATTIKVREVVE